MSRPSCYPMERPVNQIPMMLIQLDEDLIVFHKVLVWTVKAQQGALSKETRHRRHWAGPCFSGGSVLVVPFESFSLARACWISSHISTLDLHNFYTIWCGQIPFALMQYKQRLFIYLKSLWYIKRKVMLSNWYQVSLICMCSPSLEWTGKVTLGVKLGQ